MEYVIHFRYGIYQSSYRWSNIYATTIVRWVGRVCPPLGEPWFHAPVCEKLLVAIIRIGFMSLIDKVAHSPYTTMSEAFKVLAIIKILKRKSKFTLIKQTPN